MQRDKTEFKASNLNRESITSNMQYVTSDRSQTLQKIAEKLRVSIVVSKYNTEICDGLLRGALAHLKESGISESNIAVIDAPGAFEIPLIAKRIARMDKADGVICLAAVIKGDTAHFEFVSLGSTIGLVQASLDTDTPITFGILTTYTQEQATVRAKDDAFNKGREAASACVDSIVTLRDVMTIKH